MGKDCPSFTESLKPFEPKSSCLTDVTDDYAYDDYADDVTRDVEDQFSNLKSQALTFKADIYKKIKPFLNGRNETSPRGFTGESQCPYCEMSADSGKSREECDNHPEEYDDCDWDRGSCGSGKWKS